jgi:hypothetical protein
MSTQHNITFQCTKVVNNLNKSLMKVSVPFYHYSVLLQAIIITYCSGTPYEMERQNASIATLRTALYCMEEWTP